MPACNAMFIAFACFDSVFILVSAVQDMQGLPRTPWHVSQDNGYAEHWQYAKWVLLALMFSLMALGDFSAVYLGWAATFLYLLFDDSLEIHETVGLRLAERFGFPAAFGLRPQDFGELVVTGIAASILLGLIAIAYLRTIRRDIRELTHGLVALLALLAVFGVGVDMIDIAIPWQPARVVLNLVEDGGEIIVVSLMVAYVLNWSIHIRSASSL
jgi:hypothetical protein